MRTPDPAASTLAVGASSPRAGTPSGAARYYSLSALLLALLAFAVLIAACIHDSRLPAGGDQLRFTLSLLQVFGVFLALVGLVGAVGSLQRHIFWPEWLKIASAFSLTVAVVVFGFLGVWLIWETGVTVAAWWLIAVFAAGAVLAILVGLIMFSFLQAAWHASRSQDQKEPFLTSSAYAVTGLVLILDPLARIWYSGLHLTLPLVGQARQPALAFHLVAYDPIVMTLGTLACLFAADCYWPGQSPRKDLAGAIGYAAGSAMFVFALLEWARDFKSGSFSAVGVAGMTILTVALVFAVSRMRSVATAATADNWWPRIAGVVLLLLVLWSSWYGQEWHVAVDAAAPAAGSALERFGSSYAFIAIPLAGLIAALGVRRREVSPPRYLHLASLLSRVVGSVCFAFGLYSGLGVLGWWRLDITTVLGVALVVASVLVDLVRLLTWPRASDPLHHPLGCEAGRA